MICPVCFESEATTKSTVDVWSDDMIKCCCCCALMLSKTTYHQYYGLPLPEKFLKQNRQKLDNAQKAYDTVCRKRYEKEQKRKQP